jgi:selenocysteine lyase/cysteine desulfurase
MRPLTKLEKQGLNISRVPVSPERGFTLPIDIEKAILPQTRMIVMVHASNVNGIIQPIEEYGAIARKHNLLFLVDAAQSTGHLDLNVEESNIDLLAFSGHKGTFGPPGVGVLYIGARANPDTIREGGTGSFSEYEIQPEQFPDRFESGTLNSVGICGLGAGLKFIQDTGLDKIIAHEKKLVDILISGLSGIPGLILYSAPDREKQAPVVSFNIRGYDPGEVATILDQAFDIKVRSGLHCAPAAHKTLGTYPKGTVRISPGYFNTETEIEQVIQAITKIARSRN